MKRFVLILALLYPWQAFAATPTFDAAIDSTTTNATSATLSHTAGTLTNGIAIICVSTQDASTVHDGVTYGGVAATQIGSTVVNSTAWSFWYKLAPSAGASDVVADFGADNMNSIILSVATYSNVSQASPINTGCGSGSGLCSATDFDTAAPSEARVTVTSAVGELVVGCGGFNGTTATPTTSDTERTAELHSGNHSHLQAEAAGAATVDINISDTESRTNVALGISLKPSSDRRPVAPVVFQ